MKAVHTAEYFEKYKDMLFARHREMCDFEYDLKLLLPDLGTLDIPEDSRTKAIEALTTMNAQRVADNARADLKKKMRTIREIEAGRASLGYTTQVQEIRARHDLVEGFEFACYMLAQFRKKYGIT